MLEERKEEVCLVFVSTTSCIVVSLHAYTREITLHARKKTNEKITNYLVSLGCISYFKIKRIYGRFVEVLKYRFSVSFINW